MTAWKPLLRLLGLLLAGLASPAASFGAGPAPDWYHLKVYHLSTPEQAARLDTYLQRAYLPALHRAGIAKVGVFKPAEPTEPGAPAPTERLVFVFVPCRSAAQCLNLDLQVGQDRGYQSDARDYLGAAFDQPVYTRIETVLMRAFTGLPTFQVPTTLRASAAERVYELRSYEAASETLHQRKVDQFNNGEISLFKRLNFNTVFCGQVVAGSHMPNLMYLSAFENQADRDAHWKAFGDDAEWKRLDTLPEYAHNMLRMDVYLLHPALYSDI